MIVVVPGYDDYADVVGTRGLGGQGVSKIGAAYQAGRIGYGLAQKGFNKYFNYATKTVDRTKGTATGTGIGLSGGIVALLSSEPGSTPYQNGQTRNYMVKSRSKRKFRCVNPNMGRYPKRRQRQRY